MRGAIAPPRRRGGGAALLKRILDSPGMVGANLAPKVSTQQAYTVTPSSVGFTGDVRFRVSALDLGIKSRTPSRMAERGIEVTVFPATATGDDLLATKPDGVFLSNGPGDPATTEYAVKAAQQVLESETPLFGICFGNQILGRALGFGTYKLRYGHRGINQPVQDRATGRVAVTSHNHGFAVDAPLERISVDALTGGRSQPRRAERRRRRGPAAARPAGLLGAVPPRGGARSARRRLAVRLVRGAHGAPPHEQRNQKGPRLMPRRDDIDSVLVIGSGPIIIGQASEFDYSGTQACRVLRQEGLRVILVNSNPATIMTDPEIADATYVEPITPEVVRQIIDQEQPDALLATLGGQTALNTAMALHDAGVLEKFGVRLLGADIEAIRAGEDRQVFKSIVDTLPDELGAESRPARPSATRSTNASRPPRISATRWSSGRPTRSAARAAASRTPPTTSAASRAPGWRPARTRRSCSRSAILGWKEFELELMRDRFDNVVVVCSIENVDPMGVHTGDCVTVAPAMTLTDREYQRMRDVSIAIMRAVGVDAGGCNIQFAVEPTTGRLIVIEMNPRVSRIIGARVQGHRLPDREDQRQARARLHARRDRQRHHPASPRRRSSRRSTTSW